MNWRTILLAVVFSSSLLPGQGVVREKPARKPNIVLISGESELDSAGSLAKLAQELESKHNMHCTVLQMNNPKEIDGLSSLESADLSIWFLRGLDLSADQLKAFQEFLASGKPLVALGGTADAFPNWKEFGEEMGGKIELSEAAQADAHVAADAGSHPIVANLPKQFTFQPTFVISAAPEAKLLLTTQNESPLAWVRDKNGSRVFYTSLGRPEDFASEPFQKLLVNSIYWGLRRPLP